MSLHSNKKDFLCPKCSVVFIPYKTTYECPNCGYVGATPNEYLDFINLCVSSLIANKQQRGSFIPSAWFSNSLSDRIQSNLFELFALEEKEKPTDLEDFINKAVSYLEAEPHFQKYLTIVFLDAKAAYDNSPQLRRSSVSLLVDRVKSKLKTLLP